MSKIHLTFALKNQTSSLAPDIAVLARRNAGSGFVNEDSVVLCSSAQCERAGVWGCAEVAISFGSQTECAHLDTPAFAQRTYRLR